jgi:hypothetical protein
VIGRNFWQQMGATLVAPFLSTYFSSIANEHNYQFLIRAAGGVGIGTAAPAAVLDDSLPDKLSWKAVAEFSRDDKRLHHFGLFKVSIELV